MLNEENHSMTYKKYEKWVLELFLEDYEGVTLEMMKGRIDDILSESPNFMEQLYDKMCCFNIISIKNFI